MKLRLERILWPTDFSDLALRAGLYARALRAAFDSELHIIHVVPPVLAPDFSVVLPAAMPLATPEPELLEASRNRLQQLVADHFEADPTIRCEALPGNPWSTVCEYARREGINLIVLGTHGRTGLEHVLIGSTAERIVQHAPCPVLAVKGTDAELFCE